MGTVSLLYYGLEVGEFELLSNHYVYFWTNNMWKVWNKLDRPPTDMG